MAAPQGAALAAAGGGGGGGGGAAAPFAGPAADLRLGELLLDVLPIAAAVGFAADVSQCVQLCGVTWRRGDRGATNDMLVQSLRLQCGASEARAARREDFAILTPDMQHMREATTQLIRAAILNNLPRALQLIQLGAPLDVVEETWGYSALHLASWLGHEHVAKALLDGKYEGRGATIDLRSVSGMTALMRASSRGHEAVVRLLLSRGAKQELQNSDGTALHHAVRGGDHHGVVALLCAAPGAVAALALRKSTFVGSFTPLTHAIRRGRPACEAVLRAAGAPE